MTELVGILAVAVVAWFAAGTIWNVRAGRELLRWMQDGLPLLGERTTVRWLGSTAVELVINEGKTQFAKVTVVIFLEPRDLPWWPLSRLRGRRDTLIIRGILRRAPSFELEALDPASWSARDALSRVPRDWMQAGAPGGLVVHHAGAAALGHAWALLEIVQRAGIKAWRLSVRRAEPHFQLHVPLPGRGHGARDFFEAVRALADRILA
jgi:hypothetical protein